MASYLIAVSMSLTPVELIAAQACSNALSATNEETRQPKFKIKEGAVIEPRILMHFKSVFDRLSNKIGSLHSPSSMILLKGPGEAPRFIIDDNVIEQPVEHFRGNSIAVHPYMTDATFVHEYGHSVWFENGKVNNTLAYRYTAERLERKNKIFKVLLEAFRNKSIELANAQNDAEVARLKKEKEDAFHALEQNGVRGQSLKKMQEIITGYEEFWADLISVVNSEDPMIHRRFYIYAGTRSRDYRDARIRDFSRTYGPARLAQWKREFSQSPMFNEYALFAPARPEFWDLVRQSFGSGSAVKGQIIETMFWVLQNHFEKNFSDIPNYDQLDPLRLNQTLIEDMKVALNKVLYK